MDRTKTLGFCVKYRQWYREEEYIDTNLVMVTPSPGQFFLFLFALLSSCLHTNMSTMGYSDLCLGTQVTFTTPSPQKWVLEEKLTEDFQRMTNCELEMGGGPSFAVSKYLCYSATNSSKKAFMRLYFQIPNPGTESQLPQLRQQQAAPPREHLELQALKDLSKQHCTVVSALLAYKEGKQGKDGRGSRRLYNTCYAIPSARSSAISGSMFTESPLACSE